MNTDPDGRVVITPQVVGSTAGFLVGFAYSSIGNDNDFKTASFDGLQAGAAGFISGGGSLLTGFAASAGASAVRSKIDCGEVDVLNAGVNGLIAVAGGSIGSSAGASVPRNLVRTQRGLVGRFGERLGLLGPKLMDTNTVLRANVSAGVGATAENVMAGTYSGWVGGCPCN